MKENNDSPNNENIQELLDFCDAIEQFKKNNNVPIADLKNFIDSNMKEELDKLLYQFNESFGNIQDTDPTKISILIGLNNIGIQVAKTITILSDSEEDEEENEDLNKDEDEDEEENEGSKDECSEITQELKKFNIRKIQI